MVHNGFGGFEWLRLGVWEVRVYFKPPQPSLLQATSSAILL